VFIFVNIFQNRPSFEDFRAASPGFRTNFPDHMEVPRKSSGSSAKDESIPIRVFHEKHNPGEKHKYTSHNKTADLPASNNDNSSPRVTRAHSEPPKHFNQSQRPNLKTKIPLGNLAENSEHNLSTSASDPSVPSTEQPQQHQQQPNEQQQPAVRHIPIFVEGRDKPVINDEAGIKKPSEFYPSNVKVERRAQNPPTSLNVHNLKDKKQEPTSPLSPIPSDQPIPMGYTETDNAINGQPQEPTSPQPMPAGPIPMPCSPNFMNKKEASPPPPAPPQRQPQPPKLDPKDPSLQQLFKIQDNVNELVNQLDEFNGDKNSKEFKYLDEMLTRNLIALDEIESGGRPDVRQARKESINAINRCLSVLEAKAKSPDAARNNEILSELATKSSQQ
jgi:BCL2-associated athanogene 3